MKLYLEVCLVLCWALVLEAKVLGSSLTNGFIRIHIAISTAGLGSVRFHS